MDVTTPDHQQRVWEIHLAQPRLPVPSAIRESSASQRGVPLRVPLRSGAEPHG